MREPDDNGPPGQARTRPFIIIVSLDEISAAYRRVGVGNGGGLPGVFRERQERTERHPHDAIFSALGIRDPAEQCPRGVGVDDRGWDRKFRVLGA